MSFELDLSSVVKLDVVLKVGQRGLMIFVGISRWAGFDESEGMGIARLYFSIGLEWSTSSPLGAYIEILTSHWEDCLHLTETVRTGRLADRNELDIPASDISASEPCTIAPLVSH